VPEQKPTTGATDVQRVRVIFQFYDPATRNYKYRKGFVVATKLPNLKAAYELMGEVTEKVQKAGAAYVVDRDAGRAAGDSADSSAL
jgi:hypothetical protein